MLDVHPLHEPIHGRRDFLLHIATITIGLLIALGLEAGVEAIHHRHIVTQARENIRRELENNQKAVPGNLREIEADRKRMLADMTALRALRRDPNAKNLSITLAWSWSPPSDSSWRTARDTGALALMNSSTVQNYAEIYGKQQLVSDAADVLTHNQTRALVPMSVEEGFRDASPSQIDEALHHCAEIVVQLQLLDQLLTGLEIDYKDALRVN